MKQGQTVHRRKTETNLREVIHTNKRKGRGSQAVTMLEGGG